MLNAGEELVAQGVDFHDLTMIYHDVPQTIYVDACCHPNKMGYEIVADYIAERITEVIR